MKAITSAKRKMTTENESDYKNQEKDYNRKEK